MPSPYGDDAILASIDFDPVDGSDSLPTGDTDAQSYIRILSTMYRIILDLALIESPDYIGISSLNNFKNYHKIYNGLVSSNKIPGYFVKDKAMDFEIGDGRSGKFIVLKRKS